jgi:hypothetical protein
LYDLPTDPNFVVFAIAKVDESSAIYEGPTGDNVAATTLNLRDTDPSTKQSTIAPAAAEFSNNAGDAKNADVSTVFTPGASGDLKYVKMKMDVSDLPIGAPITGAQTADQLLEEGLHYTLTPGKDSTTITFKREFLEPFNAGTLTFAVQTTGNETFEFAIAVTGTHATEDPGTEDPGAEDPGTEDPGTEDPGTEDPGTEDPGTEDPGTEDPGTEDPGTEDPGTEDPGEDPVDFLWKNADNSFELDSQASLELRIQLDFASYTGPVKVDGSEIRSGTDFVASEGSTVITLQPTFLNTLAVGSHTITVQFANQVVTSQFTITKKAAEPLPTPQPPEGGAPGDTTVPLLPLLVMFAAAGGLFLTRRGWRR